LYLCEAVRPITQRITKIADQARLEALSALSTSERDQLVELLERVQGTLLQLETQRVAEHG
jgi:hypothetical protein